MSTKSKAYLLGVRKRYSLRNCSTGGNRMNEGSPPGRVDGMPASSWPATNWPTTTGPVAWMVKSWSTVSWAYLRLATEK